MDLRGSTGCLELPPLRHLLIYFLYISFLGVFDMVSILVSIWKYLNIVSIFYTLSFITFIQWRPRRNDEIYWGPAHLYSAYTQYINVQKNIIHTIKNYFVTNNNNIINIYLNFPPALFSILKATAAFNNKDGHIQLFTFISCYVSFFL